MADELKLISMNDFVGFGFLHEMNRQFLHPLGLAMMVTRNEETEEVEFYGIMDNRDDPEGIIFEDALDLIKIENVQAIRQQKATTRQKNFGWVIQPYEKTESKPEELKTEQKKGG